MTVVAVPYAFHASGLPEGRRKAVPVRILDTVRLNMHDMSDDAVLVARLPPPRRYNSAESQDRAPSSALVWYDGSFWSEIARSTDFDDDGPTLSIEDLDGRVIQDLLTRNDNHANASIASRDPGYGRLPIFDSTEAAGFKKGIQTSQADALSQIDRNLDGLAVYDGRIMRRTIEPLLVLTWGEVYRKDGRHDLRVNYDDPDSLAIDDNWATVAHRLWSHRDQDDPANPFAPVSLVSRDGYTRDALIRLEVYALTDLDRMADRMKRHRARLTPGWHAPVNVEVFRPDLLRFDRDALLYTKALTDLAVAIRKQNPATVQSVRIANRLAAIIEEIGDHCERVYQHVSEIDMLMPEIVHGDLGSGGDRKRLEDLRSIEHFEEKLGVERDQIAISGVVQFRHVQAETVYAISPDTEGVDMLSEQEIEEIAETIDGVVGTLVSDNGTLMVRVSSMYDEDAVMTEFSSALSSRFQARAPTRSSFRP